MENLLVKLMVLAARTQLGISVHEFQNCPSRGCMQMIKKKSRGILNIPWKPLTVFPAESKKFH
jgi:hypothetical protein